LLDEEYSAAREYALYLPLYNGTRQLQIGVPAGAELEPAPQEQQKPICVYGTSIVQGGCASRPGLAYPAIVGRMLNRATINLGFSGNGQAEPEVAALLAELDPAVYVLDCLPNLQGPQVLERLGPLVEIIRAARPGTPVILLENIVYQDAWLKAARLERQESSNAALQTVFRQLQEAGVTGLHYVQGEALLGDDGEGTVDGTHPNDLGFMRMAEALAPVVRPLLSS
jgi:lysophospholipase L1-like esterase